MEDDIKRIQQDKQFHLQLKSEQKEIIQNVLERTDSMAVLHTGFGKSMYYVLPPLILDKVKFSLRCQLRVSCWSCFFCFNSV